MKREIKNVKRLAYFCGCCPGHDIFPVDTYSNRRSKKARARDKKKEHRYARRVQKQMQYKYQELEILTALEMEIEDYEEAYDMELEHEDFYDDFEGRVFPDDLRDIPFEDNFYDNDPFCDDWFYDDY